MNCQKRIMSSNYEPEKYFQLAAQEAAKSLCLRRHCGAVVVKEGRIIGRGHNGPPQGKLEYRYCDRPLDKSKKYPTDKTCCVHAEVRALQDALASQPNKLKGSDLFFASVDKSGDILLSGKPYCTICSKMALDLGVARFWLRHKDGGSAYDAAEYHKISRLSGDQRDPRE